MKTYNSRYLIEGNLALNPFVLDEEPQLVSLDEKSSTVCTHTLAQESKGANRLLTALLVLALGLCAVYGVLMYAQHASAQKIMQSVSTEQILVEPQDSLWSIAAAHPIPGVSIDEEQDWLVQHNNLQGSQIKPGYALEVPVAKR